MYLNLQQICSNVAVNLIKISLGRLNMNERKNVRNFSIAVEISRKCQYSLFFFSRGTKVGRLFNTWFGLFGLAKQYAK